MSQCNESPASQTVTCSKKNKIELVFIPSRFATWRNTGTQQTLIIFFIKKSYYVMLVTGQDLYFVKLSVKIHTFLCVS